MFKNSVSYLEKMTLQNDGKGTRKHVLYLVNNDVERSIYRIHSSLFSDRNNSSTHWNGTAKTRKTLKLLQEKELVHLNYSVFCSGRTRFKTRLN